MSDEKAEEQQAIVKMEALDELQIVEDLKGRILQQFFYEFKVGTKGGTREIVGISWAGIKHIASKLMAQGHAISVPEIKVDDVGDYLRVLARAKDTYTGEERWGASEQPKAFEGGARNPFALPLAVSKAQRNAIKQFIPEIAIQEAYKEWKKKGAVSAEEMEAQETTKGLSPTPGANIPPVAIATPVNETSPEEPRQKTLAGQETTMGPKGHLSAEKLDKLESPGRTSFSRGSTNDQVFMITAMCRKYQKDFGYDPMGDILAKNKVMVLTNLTFDQAEAALKWLESLT